MKNSLVALHAVLCAGLCVAAPLDLSGKWDLMLNPEETGVAPPAAGNWDSITLPNSLPEARKGTPLAMKPVLDRTTLKHLYSRYTYIGPAYYRREFDVPADWAGRDVELSLERVLWRSEVWINGRRAGSCDSLSVPHRFDAGSLLKPGQKNTIVILVDNRRQFEVGYSHAYTDETQGFWNGVVGRMTLTDMPKSRIDAVSVATSPDGRTVTARVNFSGRKAAGRLTVGVYDDNGVKVAESTRDCAAGDAGEKTMTFAAGALPRWSEFTPRLCELRASFASADGVSDVSTRFGVRSVTTKGRSILIDDKPVFMRGTLECCIFPKTGRPDVQGAEWEKIMRTVKEYGLNHVRFHSWCPPEAAFVAADKYGVYAQVELPSWGGQGRDPKTDAFFKAEGLRILKEYGNHPSFVFLSLGNELSGDFDWMDKLVATFKKAAPDKLMTSTSFSFSERGGKAGPQDDYFISQATNSGWVRGQGFLNSVPPNTDSDYAEGVSSVPVPLLSHEVGQYNNYPNLAELPKYEGGVMRATGYEAIRDDLVRKGRLADAPRLTRDSAKLAVELYKEDIERALRTKGQAGIQLLDLHDFPGQSTATVGVLDAFWDSKGAVTPAAFRRFSGPVTPLARMKHRVWENTDTFRAGIEVANFGGKALGRTSVRWKLVDDSGKAALSGELVAESIPMGNGIRLGDVAADLAAFPRATHLKFMVELDGVEAANDWDIWVYPARQDAPETAVMTATEWDDRAVRALEDGKDVVLLPSRAGLMKPLDARFIPVFWSPLHFAGQPGTLGATILSTHPVFKDFPTATHTQWQWWELFAHSCAMDLDGLATKPDIPLAFVDKFDRNALPAAIWEARVGKGRLLVCTLDLAGKPDAIATRQLRRSIYTYAASKAFAPRVTLAVADVAGLFRKLPYVVTAPDAAPEYPAVQAIDGDPKTFWHTDWKRKGAHVPATLTLDAGVVGSYQGFLYTPRQDMANGRVAGYRFETSENGTDWVRVAEGTFKAGVEPIRVPFANPVKARFARLVCLSDHGGSGNAAVAEIALIAEGPVDVRDLGIIKGFNDK